MHNGHVQYYNNLTFCNHLFGALTHPIMILPCLVGIGKVLYRPFRVFMFYTISIDCCCVITVTTEALHNVFLLYLTS